MPNCRGSEYAGGVKTSEEINKRGVGKSCEI